jgi:hypothetical protein
MKKLLLSVAILLLVTGCKHWSVHTNIDGATWDVSYTVLGRSEMTDVHAKVGNNTIDLGKSTNDAPTGSDMLLNAILNGQLVTPSDKQ